MMPAEDDDMDNVWQFCPCCEEEYHLPEDCAQCPICLSKELQVI